MVKLNSLKINVHLVEMPVAGAEQAVFRGGSGVNAEGRLVACWLVNF